ncbi:MAG: hypothetical protein NUW22_07550, partial [Acidobacteria bacterium]|nr:hypothetical protein [Acidobacteriota bacterium]
MPTTVTQRQLVEGALKDLGVLGAGRSLSGEDAVDGAKICNELMDALATERLTIYHTLRNAYSLVASTASYTIGSGGDFSQVWPEWISEAGVILDDTADDPLEQAIRVLQVQGWSQVGFKTVTGSVVQAIYYDKSWATGLGRIYVTPIPTVSTIDLVLYTPQALTEFSSLTAEYTFPPGYRRMLRKLLALEMGPAFDVPISQDLRDQAREAKASVKRANMQFNTLRVDPALQTFNRSHYRGFNILTGE